MTVKSLKRTRARNQRISESFDSLQDECKRVIIGLDISSSVVGVCAILQGEPDSIQKPLHLGWINLKNFNNLWDKAREVEEKLEALRYRLEDDIMKRFGAETQFRVGYEEPLQRLSGGNAASSAATITMLARFNGMVGLLASQIFGDDAPDSFSVHEARKGAAIKINRGKGVKTPQKEQVFTEVCKQLGTAWVVNKTKRDGSVVPREECMDATDAWVVAVAYLNAVQKVGRFQRVDQDSENELEDEN
jgi:hypothetical protein